MQSELERSENLAAIEVSSRVKLQLLTRSEWRPPEPNSESASGWILNHDAYQQIPLIPENHRLRRDASRDGMPVCAQACIHAGAEAEYFKFKFITATTEPSSESAIS